MKERYPIYAETDVVVDTSDEPHELTVGRILTALEQRIDVPQLCPSQDSAPL